MANIEVDQLFRSELLFEIKYGAPKHSGILESIIAFA